jgi:hypothetical protein
VVKVSGVDGSVLWSAQLGGLGDDAVKGLALGPDGELIVAGETSNDLFLDQSYAGLRDVFVMRFSTDDGDLLGGFQYGSAGDERVSAVGTDAAGAVFVGGTTDTALEGQNHLGNDDAFVLKFARRVVFE